MNNISSWAIKNPIPIILLFLLLTLGGINGFMGMRINNNPDIDFPLISVTAIRPGAAPAEMEVQVTRVIEDSIAGLSGVRHIYSSVTDGVTTSSGPGSNLTFTVAPAGYSPAPVPIIR